MEIEVGSVVEYVFELVTDSAGAPVTAPSGVTIHVVRPGLTTAEQVNSATVKAVSAATFKAEIPDDYTQETGLLVVFAQSDGAYAKEIGVFQVGQPLPAFETALVPFVGRGLKGEAKKSLGPGDVSLSLELGDPFTRSVLTSEFTQLLGIAAATSPYYLVALRAEELDRVGVATYSVEGSGLRTYSQQLNVGEQVTRQFRLRLNPVLEDVRLEVFQENVGLLVSQKTNNLGETQVNLPAGTYSVRLSFQNFIFSQNNVEITVTPETDYFVLSSEYTTPAPQPDGFCNITFRLMNPDGTPLAGRKVLFIPTLALTGSGAGVVKNTIPVVSDSDGRGSINLIPGLEITVNLEGTRLYDQFIVPDQPTADLFADSLVSFEDRGFESYIAEFDYGIKRTLNP